MSNHTCVIGLGKLRKVALSYLQDIIQNLYNVKVKIDSKQQSFHSDHELPSRTTVDVSFAKDHICKRLSYIDPENSESEKLFSSICQAIIEEKHVKDIVLEINKISTTAVSVIEKWGVENEIYIGVIPTQGNTSLFETAVDEDNNKLYLHWNTGELTTDFMLAVSRMAQFLRNKCRQPTPVEYLAIQLAYYNLSHGQQIVCDYARGLGTPGFRPYTQTYMSLTDPGDGHILGTTRFNEWMKGAIVHVEHLERPRNLPRKNIESYRIPSIYEFSKVRLHVGSCAPTTYFVGRRVKDSGNFDEDFLKTVNITAASVTSPFMQGAAECKVSMEGLTTSQAVRYMQALRGQVQRNRKQVLSAAWNLNQTIIDDFEQDPVRRLEQRIDIATRAIEVTAIGGFDKITWDGASDTYPSKCIMYQLSFEEALTVVHEAHIRGLVTYFSAGFKFDEIKYAVYAGVDGIGIGGAQVLRFMDCETGMHGPYMEENIPKIMEHRDKAANSVRGRGVALLVRLDTMYFEGSITEQQNTLRLELFSSLLSRNEEKINSIMSDLDDVCHMEEEGNLSLIGTAKRLVESANPLLKNHTETDGDWDVFIKHLKPLIVTKDEESLAEEYDSDPWLSLRKNYRVQQWRENKCITRQTSFDVACKSFHC